MAPTLNSEVVSLAEVPVEDVRLASDLSSAPQSSRPVVMVVDDEELVADTLAAILTHSGYHAIKAYSGKSALRLAEHHRPSLLITDVAMPEMNGVELAMALAELTPSCKVLLFSGHATAADLAVARAAGYDFPLLAKPVPPAEMLHRVAGCLGESASAQPAPSMRSPGGLTFSMTA